MIILLFILLKNINSKKIEKFIDTNFTIIHYAIGSYDIENYGGVARYDFHIKNIFPNRKYFKAQQNKNQMLNYLKNCTNPIVITDNHLAIDIPNKYPLIIIHHGIALSTPERVPSWSGKLRNLCYNGQKKMLFYRKPYNTSIISISTFCTDEFKKHLGNQYDKFDYELILHTSELNENKYKKNFNKKPIVLGNWKTINKGLNIYKTLSKNQDFFTFQKLKVSNNNNDINDFNDRKQNIYLDCDIFLQISNIEGNSYASLDAIMNGLVLVASNVGLCYKDLPEDCFVKLDWKKNNDVDYVLGKLKYAWENRLELSKKCRKWYLENCKFNLWKTKMINNVDRFYQKNYLNN